MEYSKLSGKSVSPNLAMLRMTSGMEYVIAVDIVRCYVTREIPTVHFSLLLGFSIMLFKDNRPRFSKQMSKHTAGVIVEDALRRSYANISDFILNSDKVTAAEHSTR